MNLYSLTVFSLIVSLLMPIPLSAQSSPPMIRVDVAKRGTGEKARLTVTTKAGVKSTGYVVSAAADTFELRTKSGTQTFSYSEVAKVQKPGWSMGAKVGILVAAAVALVVVGSAAGFGDLGP